MNWEQIESKWQAMARRIRADQKDSKAPLSEAGSAKPDTTHPPENTPKTGNGASA